MKKIANPKNCRTFVSGMRKQGSLDGIILLVISFSVINYVVSKSVRLRQADTLFFYAHSCKKKRVSIPEKERGRLISDYWSPSLYCVPRQRQLASGRFRSLRSLHPSQRLLRHRFAITCIRRVPPSNVSEGGHAFREATAACRLRSASITEISFLMLWAMATVANSAQTSRLPR